jgi:RHS repeat-associated protein
MKKAPLRLVGFHPVYFTTILLGAVVVMTGCGNEPTSKHQATTSSPVTFEASCADGQDNDADGKVDCDDADCQSPGGQCKAAPDLDRTVATTLAESSAYLYQGDNPLQKDVDEKQLDSKRLAMLRGRAIGADGAPLAGVKITVKDHTEYGYTYSRGDGNFEMAVNGGARLVVNYELDGYLTVQRAVQPGWQRYVVIDDAGLTPSSAQATRVTADGNDTQTITGEPIEDDYGARQPLVVIEPGTSATAQLPNGDKQSLDGLTITVTEYPITDNNSYLPGSVPNSGGLSYGLDFAVKELRDLNAEHVAFSQPVSVYVENLSELDTGSGLSVSHYDRGSGQWEPSVTGSVIELLDVSGDKATVDSDGDGNADDERTLEEQGITDSDLKELSRRYEQGQKLWHGELKHFSAGLLQAQGTPPAGAEAPIRRGLITRTLDTPHYASGAVIEHQASVHEEPIVGTPFNLHYQSNRTLSYGAGRLLEVPLIGDTVPTGLVGVRVQVAVAGHTYSANYPTASQKLEPNLRFSAAWDGTNISKKLVQGQQTATVTMAYVYRDAKNKNLSAVIPVTFDVPLGAWDARAFKLGGFAIDAFHSYDPAQQIVYFGHGGQRSGYNVALTASPANRLDSFTLGTPDSLVVASDGSLIFTDDQSTSNSYGRVIRITPDGTPSVLFGPGAPGDAANVQMTQPQGVAVLNNGHLIIADIADQRLVELNPTDGSMRTLVSGFDKDKPLVKLSLDRPTGLTLGPRQDVYFVDGSKVYRYEAGAVTVYAGGGSDSSSDNIKALSAKLVAPTGLVIDKQYNLYVSERGADGVDGGHRVRKITPGGVIVTIAGTGTAGFSGDEGDAKQAQLSAPHGLALDDQGQLYIVDYGNNRIRKIATDGTIQTVIGGGEQSLQLGSLAVNVKLNVPDGIALGPDGSIYIATMDTVLKAYPGLRQLSTTDHLIPSVDGHTLYRFDARGKHLETIDAMTGVVELTFAYDAQGLLASITDTNGNATTIKRDSNGNPTAIIAPTGQETTLDVKDNGDVATMTDAIGRKVTITWTADKDGLIEKVDDPKAHAPTFRYDVTGRLTNVIDPLGYVTTLARTDTSSGWSVAVTRANGNKTDYKTEYGAEKWKRTVTHADGTKSASEDNGAMMTRQAIDGTKEKVTFNADTSFGSQVLVPYDDTVTLPSGKAITSTSSRDKEMADVSNPLQFSKWLESTTVNDRYASVDYDRSTKTLTQTSPMGRVTELTLDDLGRPAKLVASGMPEVTWDYDGKGRVKTVTRTAGGETRVQSYAYDDNGWLDYFTDALNEKTDYGFDLVGRLDELIAPDLAKTAWDPDDANNITAYTPPGRPNTVFTYDDKTKLLKSITPPSVTGDGVGANAGRVTVDYGKVNEVTKMTRAGAGSSIAFSYDSLMRLSKQTFDAASINFYYTRGHLTRINRTDGVTVDQTFDGPLWTGSVWKGSISGDIKATYNENLWLSSLTVNSASTVNYKYDDDGLITSASATAGVVTLNRDALSGYINGIAAGDTTSTQSFSKFGELDHIAVAYTGSNLFEQTIKERDALGRIKHLTETVQGVAHDVAYDYDLAGRLWKQTRDGVTTTYLYDPNGNRTSVQVGSNAASVATFDDQDRILTSGTQTFVHTDSGDLKTRIDAEGKQLTLTYDALGNLLKVVGTDGSTTTTVEYVVDGLGRRVARRINGTFDRAWTYRDSLRPESEVDSAGVFTHYVYSSNNPESGAPIALIRAGVMYRIVKDQLGSVRMVVNAQTGEVAQSIDYDAYGRALNETGAGFQPFGFAGGLYDATTKLVRFGARDYDPGMGRWTNKDPIGFAGQQGNVYLYVNGEPVNGVDPGGMDVFVCSRIAENKLLHTFGVEHQWIETDTFAFGIDGGFDRMVQAPHRIGDGKGHWINWSKLFSDSQCTEVLHIDENCVNNSYHARQSYPGYWSPWNNCRTFVSEIINKCSIPAGNPVGPGDHGQSR